MILAFMILVIFVVLNAFFLGTYIPTYKQLAFKLHKKEH